MQAINLHEKIQNALSITKAKRHPSASLGCAFHGRSAEIQSQVNDASIRLKNVSDLNKHREQRIENTRFHIPALLPIQSHIFFESRMKEFKLRWDNMPFFEKAFKALKSVQQSAHLPAKLLDLRPLLVSAGGCRAHFGKADTSGTTYPRTLVTDYFQCSREAHPFRKNN